MSAQALISRSAIMSEWGGGEVKAEKKEILSTDSKRYSQEAHRRGVSWFSMRGRESRHNGASNIRATRI